MNSIFSRICLVLHANSMFDDGKVHCRVYDPWLSWIYKQIIAWSDLDLLKYCLDPYKKQIKM